MRFVKNLYAGESVEKKKNLLKWKLLQGRLLIGTYLIALPENGSDPLEIYHNSVLKQKYYRKYPPLIVGIAGSFEEAVMLSWKIISDAGENSEKPDIRAHFKLQEREA